MPFQRPLGERVENQTIPHFIRPLQDKRVIVGQKVILECQIEGHPDPVIKWLKDGHNVTSCPDYELMENEKKHSLVIRTAQGADSGRFTCQAMNAAGIQQSTCMLIVAPAPTPVPGGYMSIANSPAPPQTPVGPSAPFFLKEVRNQPMKPGEKAVFEGRVVGVPTPTVEWLKNGKVLANYRLKTEFDAQTGIFSLIIPQLFNEDIAEYTCRASNEIGTASSTAKILPKEEFDKWFADEARQVTHERKQKMLQQQPQRLTPLSQRNVAQRQMERNLYLSSNFGSDSEAGFGIFSESETEPELAGLNMRGTAPIFHSELRGLKLTEGTDAILQCNIIGNPKPRISWFKNGRPLNQNGSQKIQINFKGSLAILKISNVTPEDSGEYIILADNNFGKAQNSARIEVFPLFSKPEPQNFPIQTRQAQPASHYQTPVPSSYQQPVVETQKSVSEQHKPLIQEIQYSQPIRQQQVRSSTEYFYEPTEVGSPYVHQHYSQPVQQQPSWRQPQPQPQQIRVESNLDFDFEPSSKPHPYQRLPEQTQYLLQQHQQQQQQQFEMPPVQFKKATNGVLPQQPEQQPLKNVNKSQTSTAATVKPPIFVQHPQPAVTALGGTVIFTAKITGQPIPQISWVKANGQQIPNDNKKYQISSSGDTYILKINQIQQQDFQNYACIAKNAGGAVQSGFNVVVKETKKAEVPQFVGKFQSVTIYEGDLLKLYCKAVNDVVKMTWSRDGTSLTGSTNIRIENKGQGESILYLSDAKMSDGGWYQCDATNAAGTTSLKGRVVVQSRAKFDEPMRERITLRKVDRREALKRNVEQQNPPSKEVPKFTSQLQSLSLMEGQNALLDVQYTPTNDPNLKIAWLLNGKALLASSRVTQQNDFGHAVLEINPVTVFDHGEYTVVALNQLGEMRQTATVEVVGYRSPSVNAFLTAQQEGIRVAQSVYQEQQIQNANTLFGSVHGPSNVSPSIDRPNFHSELRSQEIFEGQPLHLETKLTPFNDPNLTLEFLLNGHQIQPNDHVQIQVEHGFVVISIVETQLSDAGYYQIIAANERGEAETAATVLVHPRADILQENHAYDVEDVRDIQYSVGAGQKLAPQFLSQIQDYYCQDELGRSYFEARISPINDSSLRVVWLKDGLPLPNANRIQTFHNFGFVSLTLHPTYPEDAGLYTCQLNNDIGETKSTAKLSTIAQEVLQLDPLHENSLQTITQLESQEIHIGPILQERPEEFNSMELPRVVRPLESKIEVDENEPVHFEARIQPASDVKMTVEWFHNGAPIAAAHRFRPMFDFGYVALDILYVYPEDSGTYTMVAKNELGQTESTLELVVHKQGTLYLDPQHPEGLERIQELEQPKNFGLAEVADRECDNPPHFLGNLSDLELNEHSDLHFELKLTPVHDPTMVVEWFLNDQPVITGSRVRHSYDFGFIAMDIKGVIPEDSGTYTVRALNALGEDVRQCQVTVIGKDAILSSTQHEESIAKIHYLENLDRYGRAEIEDVGPDSGPQFVQQLTADSEIEEGLPLHLECKVEPLNDNSLRIEWYKNGHPLPHAHRFRTFHDFGFISLDILHFYAEDSGTYSCVARNFLGEAETSIQIHCERKLAFLFWINFFRL